MVSNTTTRAACWLKCIRRLRFPGKWSTQDAVVTPDDVERLVMALPGVTRNPLPHWGVMTFKRQRVFAVIRNAQTLLLRTSLNDHQNLTEEDPLAFPVWNGKGPKGVTAVALDLVDEATLQRALTLAWWNAGSKHTQLAAGCHDGL